MFSIFEKGGSRTAPTTMFTALFVLLCLLGCTPSELPNADPRGAEASGQPDVLLITIDTLRADHLPLHGYDKVHTPHLDALATQSVVFDKAWAHTPITLPSHTSILTGLYPPQHGVRNNGSFHAKPELTTMPELFKENGYMTAGFISAFVLDSRFGLDQGFDFYDDDMVDGRRRFSKFGVKDRRAKNTVNRVFHWLDDNTQGNSKPFFIWTHLYDPHFAYEPPEPFRSRYAHPYDGEIAYTDQEIGRLLDDLKRRGRFDNTLIIITGDHGESLGEHGESTHSIFIYEATQWIPLIVKLPKAEHGGRRFGGLVRHIDILPTVIETMDLENLPAGLAGSLPGTSLVSRMSGAETAPVSEAYAEAYLPMDQFGWSPLYAWRDSRHKYIEAPTAELYDLDSDPREQTNIVKNKPKNTDTFKAKLNQLLNKLTPVSGTGASKKAMDEETVAKLKALGYISESEPSKSEQGKDPKEMVHLYEAREEAHRYMENEAYETAIPILRRVLEEDPSNPSTHSDLAAVYAELQRWDEAAEEYLKAQKLAPNRSDSHRGLAKVYFKGLGNFAGAEREIEAAFALASHDPSLWTLKGDFLHEQRKMAAAAAAYQKAVDGGEQNASMFTGYASALTNMGELDLAREMAEEAIRIDNENIIAHYNLGVILEQQGDQENAVAAYRVAIRLKPTGNMLAYENLGNLLTKTGREGEAAQTFQAALRIDPKAAGALYHLGSLHLKNDRVEQALPLLEKSVAVRPDSAPGRTNLGYAYLLLERFDDAFEQYRVLTRIYPKAVIGHADAWLRMARVRARQGRKAEASRLLKTAIATGGPAIAKAAENEPLLRELLPSDIEQ